MGLESLHEFPIFGYAIFSRSEAHLRAPIWRKSTRVGRISFEESGWLLLAVGSRLAKPELSWIAVMAINTISDRRLHDQSALLAAQAVPFGTELFAAAPPARWRPCGGLSAGSKGMQRVTGCIPGCVSATTGVLQMAAYLLHHKISAPWARSGHIANFRTSALPLIGSGQVRNKAWVEVGGSLRPARLGKIFFDDLSTSGPAVRHFWGRSSQGILSKT